MTRRVLVALDRSDRSTKALEHALSAHPDAEFVLVHVVDPARWLTGGDEETGEPYYSRDLEEAAKAAGDDLLADAAERAREAGATVETVRLVGGPARRLLEYLREEDTDVDQVVMGSHGRTGLDRLLMGSVAEKVTRRSPVPVTVVR